MLIIKVILTFCVQQTLMGKKCIEIRLRLEDRTEEIFYNEIETN